jgi:hypothetical protein
MNVAEMVSEIDDAVQDSSYDSDAILAKLNQARLEIANKFCCAELMDEDTITFTSADGYAELPSDYHHDVFWAWNNTADAKVVFYVNRPMIRHLHRAHLTSTGDVRDLCLQGSRIYGYPLVESDQTLAVNFYKQPAAFTADGDGPDWIPEHLHEPVLVNWCVVEFFKRIEDGEDGTKANTQFYNAELQVGLRDLWRHTSANPCHEPRMIHFSSMF